MATRPECIQKLADLLGDTFVTMENHARSMGSAPGRYSTRIGRGNRNVDLGPDWIASCYLAAVRNDPKNAALKVPMLGNLKPSSIAQIERRTIEHEEQPPGVNALAWPLMREQTQQSRMKPAFVKAAHETLFDFICDNIEATGRWIADDWGKSADDLGKVECPIYKGLSINVTVEPEPKAIVSFDLSETPDEQIFASRYYLQRGKVEPLQENQAIPLERIAIIPYVHILRLGQIYAHSLIASKVRAEIGLVTANVAEPNVQNKEADNLAGSSASSESQPHDDTRLDTDTPRKESAHTADPTVSVCLSSRGIETLAWRQTHARHIASHQYGLSLA